MKRRPHTTIGQLILSLAALTGAGSASATLLTSEINMDNAFQVYISTSDSAAGALFGVGDPWMTTFTHTTTLAAGVNYFLHVYGHDQGGIAGFLGEFNLNGSDHKFANNLTTLVTNTTNWVGNSSGFNGLYGALTDLGVNGVGPWGYQPAVAGTAHWIWSGNAYSNDNSYFSTQIVATSAVPEPASLALLGISLLGLATARRRQRAQVKA